MPSNFVHVFIVEVDKIVKRPNVARCAWSGRSFAFDIALHFERLFFAVLAPSERLGHITLPAAGPDAPVSGSQLCVGCHAGELRCTAPSARGF